MHDDAIAALRGMYAFPPHARHCKKKQARPPESRIKFILISHVASLLRERRVRSPDIAAPQIQRRRGEELRHERCVILPTSEHKIMQLCVSIPLGSPSELARTIAIMRV